MKLKAQTSSNYNYFITADTSPYKGEWIAISKKKIISHGKNAQDVYNMAKRISKTTQISLAKVPDEQMLILKFSL